uniref:DNA polymerase nu n=1 Tax=Leptobrachium leishanense TaxID=445787 RepID=A0A8C5LW67_9ANUR
MEKYRQEFGVYNYQEPLSNIAGRIMAALKTDSSHKATCDKFAEQFDVGYFSRKIVVSAADNVEHKWMCDGSAERFCSSDLTLNESRFMRKTLQQEARPSYPDITLPNNPAAKHHGRSTPWSSCVTSLVVEKEKMFNDIEENHESFLQKLSNFHPEGGRTCLPQLSQEQQICDIWSVKQEEKCMLLEEIKRAEAVIITMMYQDGSTQLNPSKDLSVIVDGIVISVRSQEDPLYCESVNIDRVISKTKYFYITIGNKAFSKTDVSQSTFSRNLLLSVLQRNKPAICFNAKDFLRTVLSAKHVSWKNVLKSVLFDPSIAGWLLNPEDCSPSFQHLVKTYCEKLNIDSESNASHSQHQDICSSLDALNELMMNLQTKLLSEGLWTLFCTIELPLISILAVMENQKVQVNQEELKRTSELIGIYLKELEHDAYTAAGEKFKVTSSKDLREILFDKLRLHLQCKSKLPRTSQRQFPSTAETVLHQLQDLHPLPKIILEFRQGHVSSTWNQTGTVSGRLSAKHPNIQGVPKLPVQISKPQYIQGKDRENVTVNPRSMFTSAEGYTFLAADFSQVELRLIAHFSSDPELLKLFQGTSSTDVFTKLASQWKDIAVENVTQVDREQAKRVSYSVIYGAGKDRLAECLGVTPIEANAFIARFLQKYKLSEFTQSVIHQCHQNEFVISVMGRKRPLPKINAQNYILRAQAERQAVNFVIQGSAADLCKMAMIKISASIASSSDLTARLIAQIHDELLFEVEDSQIDEFAALVKGIMESLQHVKGIELKVPLKVTLSSGKSWGCMTELQGKNGSFIKNDTSEGTNRHNYRIN